ncbi:MAG: EutN/CcmL family microcompartment protein [Planctomycetota bacterium]
MKIARTIGTVTLSRSHPAMASAKLRCVEVVDSIDRLDEQPLGGDTVVAWDLCGTGIGDLVGLAEGPESAQPFRPDIKPLDASIVALLDDVDVDVRTPE